MKSLRNATFVAVALMLFGTRLFGQTVPCSQQSVYLDILRQGPTDSELNVDGLLAKLEKEHVKVLSVQPGHSPRRVIVLLDSSGSVLSSPFAWRVYVAITRNLVTNLPNGATAKVVVFADQIDMVIPVTDDHAKLDAQLKPLEAGWGYFRKPRASALWDAMKAASDMYGEPKNGDVLYVLSDGDDNASRIRFNDVETKLRSKPIELQLISANALHKGAEAWRGLQNLAIATGGSTVEISGKPGSQALLHAVPHSYRMEIEVPPQAKTIEKSGVIVTETTLEGTGIKYSGRLSSCVGATTGNESH
jgi:VWA domain-containing protein